MSGARWQSDDQLHLTLRFIGEVDRHGAVDVAAALGGIHHPRFEIALSGVGSFDKRGVRSALWAGAAPQEPLKTLHNKVDQAMARAGIAPDTRAFLPHVTLARLNRSSGPIDAFVARHGGWSSAPFAVTDFALFESDLTPDGAVYTVVERYRLE